MKKVSVYGSLLSGLGNHGFLRTSKLLATETVKLPFRMIGFGSSFPGLVKDNVEHKIIIETWEVDDNTYKNIESLEGYPSFYDKAKIKTSVGNSEIYFLNDSDYSKQESIKKIDGSFNWKQYLNNK